MTNHKLLPPIHIHPLLFVFLLIAFLTGTFFELFIILTIVLFHELGHYVMAKRFKWRVERIVLWVFGGVMDSEEHGTRSIKEDMFVTIAGPLQHVFIYMIIFSGLHFQFISQSIAELALFYNTMILLFNLLPIWPLDGGKLLFSFLSAFFPYRKAYDLVIGFSMAACLVLLFFVLFIFPFTLSAFLIIAFLFMENRSEWKQRYYVFIRFLLQRYHGASAVSGVRPIVVPYEHTLMDVFELFHRDKKHPIYVTYPEKERKSIDENDCLRSFFHDKDYHKTIGEIAEYYL